MKYFNYHRWGSAVISIIIALALMLPFYFIYINIEDKLVAEVKQNAITIARITAIFVEKDIEQYRDLYNVDDYENQLYDKNYYQRMLLEFQKIREQTDARYIFTEKRLSDTKIAYIFDSESPDSENFSPIGSHDELGQAEREAFNKNYATASELISNDRWGVYITGYAPIIDAKTDQNLGLVGVDFPKAYIYNQIKDLRNLFYIVYTLLAALIIYFINNLLHRYRLRSSRDYLTGIHNRRSLDDNLDMAIKSHKNKPLSIAIIDIDEFKKINDEHGHIYGDRIIKKVANHIVKHSRKTDIVTRYGGDEFVVILSDTTASDAKHICERMIKTIDPVRVYDDSDVVQNVTLSIGLASKDCLHNTCENLLEYADKALLIAKQQGKNRCVIFENNVTTVAK